VVRPRPQDPGRGRRGAGGDRRGGPRDPSGGGAPRRGRSGPQADRARARARRRRPESLHGPPGAEGRPDPQARRERAGPRARAPGRPHRLPAVPVPHGPDQGDLARRREGEHPAPRSHRVRLLRRPGPAQGHQSGGAQGVRLVRQVDDPARSDLAAARGGAHARRDDIAGERLAGRRHDDRGAQSDDRRGGAPRESRRGAPAETRPAASHPPPLPPCLTSPPAAPRAGKVNAALALAIELAPTGLKRGTVRGGVALNGLEVLKTGSTDTCLTLPGLSVKINDADMVARAFTIGAIEGDGLSLRAVRDAQEKIDLVALGERPNTDEVPPAPSAPSAPSPANDGNQPGPAAQSGNPPPQL